MLIKAPFVALKLPGAVKTRLLLAMTRCGSSSVSTFSRSFSGESSVQYLQGQSPSDNPKAREYFYFIDHQGQLFLDDTRMKNFTSCFKEKQFLEFFFKRLRKNDTGNYTEQFPFFSPCGRERNYVRCEDVPIVFTEIIQPINGLSEKDRLSYCGTGPLLTVPFEPEKLCMLPESGRIYHPAPENVGSIGLIKSSIAIAISKHFYFKNGEMSSPTHFSWKGQQYKLTNEILSFTY